jgi:hypothetical protein
MSKTERHSTRAPLGPISKSLAAGIVGLLLLGPLSAPFIAAAVWNLHHGRNWIAALWFVCAAVIFLTAPLAAAWLLGFDTSLLMELLRRWRPVR